MFGESRGGFPHVPAECYSILEMSAIPEYAHLVDLVKARLLKIVKSLFDERIISPEDLKVVSE